MDAEDDGDVQPCVYCANLKALRDFLPPKRCDYCRKWRCQFCTLKFPLIVKRKGLPKVLKGNSRICVQCFGKIWQEDEAAADIDAPRSRRGITQRTKHVSLPDTHEERRESRGVSFVDRSSMFESGGRRGSMFDSGSMMGSTRRSSIMSSSRRGSLLDSDRRASMMVDRVWAGMDSFGDSFMDSPGDNEVTKRPTLRRGGLSFRIASFLGLVPSDGTTGSITSAIDLWMSLFAASILMVIALADGFSLQQRVVYCVATYGFFLVLHPWIHASRADDDLLLRRNTAESATNSSAIACHAATPGNARQQVSTAALRLQRVPAIYKSRIHEMESTMAYYLSDESPWKMVKTARGATVFEMTANKTPFPIFKIEVFITGISVAEFMAFLDSKDPRDRAVWDLNEANFEVIETFDNSDDDEDAEVSVCINTQKPFLGGIVAPRDFCLLYLSKEDSICFSSVEHPSVPVRPGTTRGNIYFSCFHCVEESPTEFALTYICQADIGGSLPVKLRHNGTIDNMEKMTKVFQQAKRLFPRDKVVFPN